MTDLSPFERRLAASLDAYADRAPTDVDPLVTARLAAAMALRRPLWLDALRMPRAAAATLLVVGLATSMAVGALVSGSRPDHGGPGTVSTPDSVEVRPTQHAPDASPAANDPAASIIASYAELHVGFVFVYADGRVVVHPDSGDTLERRLSPSGVEQVRSAALLAETFLEAPATLPAGVWAEAEFRTYRPRLYALCARLSNRLAKPAEFVGFLPADAEAMLRGRERTYDVDGNLTIIAPGGAREMVETPVDCFEVTADELAKVLELVGGAVPNAVEPSGGAVPVLVIPHDWRDGDNPPPVSIFADPILPHGSPQVWGG